MPLAYYILRVAALCVGISLMPLAVTPWIGRLDGFREPDELSRSVAALAVFSSLTALNGLLLIVPHRWSSRGLPYAVKLTGLLTRIIHEGEKHKGPWCV